MKGSRYACGSLVGTPVADFATAGVDNSIQPLVSSTAEFEKGNLMLVALLTEERIQDLLAMPKTVVNKGAREIREGKSYRLEYRAVARKADEEFIVFVRRHIEMEDNFTAGLRWTPKSGEPVILMRCNGGSHPHTNQLEKTEFPVGHCHIHIATERYIEAGKNAEHYAETTSDFQTYKGALHVLCNMCNIFGLDTGPDEPDLFRK